MAGRKGDGENKVEKAGIGCLKIGKFIFIQTHPPTPFIRGTADARVLKIEH